MNPAFAVCSKRIDGAAEDFKGLGRQLKALREAYGGEPVLLRHEIQNERQRLSYYVDGVMPLPEDWDRRVAHILYDVRSALDHLIQELYVATNGKRPSKRTASLLQFPICTTAGAWRYEVGKKHRLDGIGDRFAQIVRKHQPYRIKQPWRHALARLRTLSDQDKHRRPSVVFTAARDFQIKVHVNGIGTPRVDPVGVGRALKVGAEFAHIYVVPWGPMNLGVDVQNRGTFSPSLGRGVIVDDLLVKVIETAWAVVRESEAEWRVATGRLPI